MSVQKESAFELLKKLEFTRTAGSKEEWKALKILEEELHRMGAEGNIESFEIDDALMPKATLKAVEPEEKEYVVTGYQCCASTAKEGLTAELIYGENLTDVNLAEAKGKIVLVNGRVTLPMYKKIVESGAAAMLSMSGTLLDEVERTDLPTRKIRKNMAEYGLIPAAHIRIADAFELVARNVRKVCLCVENTNVTSTSHNLIARIEGTTVPEEIIVLGAHYDSVEFSKGVYDNGAGSVLLMELFRYFRNNPPRRTMEFVWFGSEEIGLQGSWNYVRTHKEALASCRLMVNIDVAAPVLGFEHAAVTGSQSFEQYVDYWTKIKGYPVVVKRGTYSSDSIPFADAGIQCINFSRDGAPGGAFLHSRHDVIQYLSADSLDRTRTIIQAFVEEMGNAVVFPVPKEMPEEMKEQIDRYLFRGKWACEES